MAQWPSGAAALALGGVAAVLVRILLAFSPYSGEGKPPMHGDYEAQRHWMEITTALPVGQWYENSSANDLGYWGLDYPPLTAYHSWLLGKVGHAAVPECFQLVTSRGHESPRCRLFMRTSVIVSDLLVYFPGSYIAVQGFAAKGESADMRTRSVLALWLLPPLLLIDHGHFQYNGVCFGLCLAAAGLVASGRTLAASVLFTAGLLFKQIALYYAPAFFFCILAQCLREGGGIRVDALLRVLVTGIAVLSTVFAMFLPWLLGPTPLASAGQVLHRMFPFARGLYEDKVANVWCTISVVVKLQRLLPAKRIPLFCAVVTLTALLPACVCCLRGRRRQVETPGAFAAALTCSALAFFLFAFQVHEKGILFPCVAACLLPVAIGPQRRPRWAGRMLLHFLLACLFSMFPLVVKDELHVAYAVLCLGLIGACETCDGSMSFRVFCWLSYLVALLLHAIHAFVPPPARYPHLWVILITGSSCAYFVLCLAVLTMAQLHGVFDSSVGMKKMQ